MSIGEESTLAARVGLILQQIDALPTLSPVAIRVLELAGSHDGQIEEIVQLIESDQSLSAKLLALTRRADLGLGGGVQRIERAVLMLGLDAVRAAVLSFEVFEALESGRGIEDDTMPEEPSLAGYDRRKLWRHLIACAAAAELLAERHQVRDEVSPDEAFLCGLLHDLGMLALDRVLPRTFAKAAAIAEQRQTSISAVERQLIGLDHHVAGKRLAEHWKLPQVLQDVMWLSGHSPEALPDLDHRPTIALVGVAAEVARQQHLGWCGDFRPPRDLRELMSASGLSPTDLDDTVSALHERVADRARLIGLDDIEDKQLLVQSLVEANRKLGRLAQLFEERSRQSRSHGQSVRAIGKFLAPGEPPRTLNAAFAKIARCAGELAGAKFCAGIVQAREGAPWQLFEHTGEGESVGTPRPVEFPGREGEPPLAKIADMGAGAPELMAELMPQLSEPLRSNEPRVLPMVSGWGPTAIMLTDADLGPAVGDEAMLRLVLGVWAASVASATQQAGLRRLGERLSDASRQAGEMQAELVEARAHRRLAEIAAGAAHEMNNPLTVISGKSQLLAGRLRDPEQKRAISDVVSSAGQLAALIEGLHFFASPPAAARDITSVGSLVQGAIEDAQRRIGIGDDQMLGDDTEHFRRAVPEVHIAIDRRAEVAYLDESAVRIAVTELLTNAFEAEPDGPVLVEVQPTPSGDRLELAVIDDGHGLSDQAIHHACDPFFSEKRAGRQSGLGLAKAARVAEQHGGRVELVRAERGTRASISIADWRADGVARAA
ncbi:MAG: HDOD domain-containing protein [Planctomycetota bacterium]